MWSASGTSPRGPSPAVRGRVARAFLALFLLAALALPACANDPSGERDAQLVHCLTAAEPVRVAEAAVALGLADRASRSGAVVLGDEELSLDQWRKRAPEDFARTCAAVASADAVGAGPGDGSSDGGLLTSVASLLAAILGGAAAGLATEYLNRRGRRFQYAVELRASLTSFQRTGVAYLRGWCEPGTPRLAAAQLTAACDELDDKLRRVAEERPAWTGLITLRRKLSDGPLGGDLDGWLVPAATQSERLEELRGVLQDITDRAERIAVAIEKPMLHWLLLHRSPSRTAPPAAGPVRPAGNPVEPVGNEVGNPVGNEVGNPVGPGSDARGAGGGRSGQ